MAQNCQDTKGKSLASRMEPRIRESAPLSCQVQKAMTVTTATPQALLCGSLLLSEPFSSKPSISHRLHQLGKPRRALATYNLESRPKIIATTQLFGEEKGFDSRTIVCHAARRKPAIAATVEEEEEIDGNVRRVLQVLLWVAEATYILWLFLLPYAPGDPVWAISSETVNSLVGLSLNFFFILPLMNSVGITLIDAPVLHPMSEGLFNFVIGWTFMFAPLLFTDCKRDRYKGSLDVLWGFQMFLTNTFLIPYMAIRLNTVDTDSASTKRSQLASVMTKGAPIVGLVGGGICVISTLWALFGRTDGNFGDITDRYQYLVSYLGSERLAYAFIWDICLYIIFQPWLIGDNIQNVEDSKIGIVKYLRFVPVVGLVAYLLCLNLDEEL